MTGFRGEPERCCKEPWMLRQRATAGWRCWTLSKTWIVRRTSRSGNEEVRAGGLGDEPKTLSIIIPAIDEADGIESALAGTEGIPSVTERIVVDGGSRDGTEERARACGAKVIASAPMRSAQMNAGARAAEGTVLLFLHADTRLPPGFEHHVLEILDRPDTVAGAFRLGIDGHFPGLRVIEWLANFRSICMGMPYGDQAIFIAADRFHRAGGFPEIPIMEDFAFMRRLRSRGRIGIARTAVTTSARRYDEYGFWRTTWINQLMIIAYLGGISPARLARWYRSGLRRQEPTPSQPSPPPSISDPSSEGIHQNADDAIDLFRSTRVERPITLLQREPMADGNPFLLWLHRSRPNARGHLF